VKYIIIVDIRILVYRYFYLLFRRIPLNFDYNVKTFIQLTDVSSTEL